MADKKITIEDKKKKDEDLIKKKNPLKKLNLPEKLDKETTKKISKVLRQWLDDTD